MNHRQWLEHSLREGMVEWFSAIFERFKGKPQRYVNENWPKERETRLEWDEDAGRWIGVTYER